MPEAQALMTSPLNETEQSPTKINKASAKVDPQQLVKLWNKGLSITDLANHFKVSKSAICQRLDKLIGTSEERTRLELFEANKHYALTKIQQIIVANLTEDDIKKLPADKKGWLFGTLEHNKRLLTGQSTSNVSHLLVVKKVDEEHYQGNAKDNKGLKK